MPETHDIRSAEASDIDQLARIWHDGWHDAHAAVLPAALTKIRTLESFQERTPALIPQTRVAGPVGAVVGFCTVQGDELYQLYVSKAGRGTGVAATLIADAESRLIAAGTKTAWLSCAIGNDRAARFYEKHGWHRASIMNYEAQTPQGPFPLEVWRYEKPLRASLEPPRPPYPPILRVLVGSTVHGLNVEDGIEDRDEMGVCLEDYAAAQGFGPPFEQYIYRSAAIREGRPDAKSYAGDLDLVIYSLRKWLRLALNGSPTIMLLLFASPLHEDRRGTELRALAPAIISRRAGRAYLGYLDAQRQRLTGERGGKDVNRPELVARYGFDTKYAMHMLRLGYQGIELMQTGRLSLPMPEPERTWLRNVRTGGASLPEVLARATDLRATLESLLETSPLPDHPDTARVERWMLETYWASWTEPTLRDA